MQRSFFPDSDELLMHPNPRAIAALSPEAARSLMREQLSEEEQTKTPDADRVMARVGAKAVIDGLHHHVAHVFAAERLGRGNEAVTSRSQQSSTKLSASAITRASLEEQLVSAHDSIDALRIYAQSPLPSEQRAAFTWFELEGFSGHELAERQQVPINTVWLRLHGSTPPGRR